MFELKPIPQDKKHNWKVRINGEEQSVALIEISSQYGTLTYGLRPEGYDGWAFREQGGGGSVTVPYTRTPDGMLLVGLLPEKRDNMGADPVLCVMGGFIKPGETHDQAQIREAADEGGIDAAASKALPGKPSNSNRAFFVADAAADEGVHAYGLFIPFSWLAVDGEHLKLKDAALLPAFKKASDLCFFPWKDAIGQSPDALALAAIAQLLAAAL